MTELAYDERGINFNTQNTTVFSTAAASLIGGLDVTVVGTGAAVLVEFYCPSMVHVPSMPFSQPAVVTSYFVTNGAITNATSQFRKWTTTQSPGGVMRRRMVLDNGVPYTFQVGLAGGSAGVTTAVGQVTVGGTSAGVMHLRITD